MNKNQASGGRFSLRKNQGLFLSRASAGANTPPEINLIPFIDVLLVILIFLMISTTFTRFQELAIALPSASGADSVNQSQQIHLAVSRDGRYALNGRIVSNEQLSNALAQLANTKTTDAQSPPQVSIDADARATHQAVMTALEAARDANLSNIVFTSQTK
ncbi:MAG: biopolymer transporter ExbD [Polynucleobacter sp.]|nr:biopolymer transporter ExbD [Polynucleobacter sp.]